MTDDDDLLFEELAADMERIAEQGRLENLQVWRRAWCRAVFAWIEGELASAKRLRLTQDYWLMEEDHELAIQDLRRTAAADGRHILRPLFLPLLEAAKLTLHAYAAHSRAASPVTNDDPGWAKLASAIKIRNRIVHPKAHADIHLSDDDVRLVRDASEWFFEALLSAQDLYVRAEAHRLRARVKRAGRYFRRHRKDQT